MSGSLRKTLTILCLAIMAGSGGTPAFCAESADPQPQAKAAAEPTAKKPLTTEELEILQHGEIGTGSLIGGGLLGTFVGLGLGHVVYGQYGNKGWIFTVGELTAMGIVIAGSLAAVTGCLSGNDSNCSNGLGMYVVGTFAYIGFRVWEAVDVWTLPGSYNSRYRAIKAYSEGKSADTGFLVVPFAAPGRDSSASAGLAFSYRF